MVQFHRRQHHPSPSSSPLKGEEYGAPELTVESVILGYPIHAGASYRWWYSAPRKRVIRHLPILPMGLTCVNRIPQFSYLNLPSFLPKAGPRIKPDTNPEACAMNAMPPMELPFA